MVVGHRRLKKILISLLFLLCTAYINSQEAVQFNYSFWEQLTEDGKALFLIGVGNGIALTKTVIYRMDEKAILESVTIKLSDERNIGQVVQQINTFYSDNPKQRKLPVVIVYLMLLEASKID